MIDGNDNEGRLQLSRFKLLSPILRHYPLDVIQLEFPTKQNHIILNLSKLVILLRDSVNIGQETVNLSSGEIRVSFEFLKDKLLESEGNFLVGQLLGLVREQFSASFSGFICAKFFETKDFTSLVALPGYSPFQKHSEHLIAGLFP